MNTSSDKLSAFNNLKKDILQLIQNKVFLGRYIEKRYVESLGVYRDIILIEQSEDIVQNLMQTRKALESYSSNKWIGISNDPQNSESDDCLLWVQLNNVPIGKHWFRMSAIRFKGKEIFLEVQHIQPFRSPDGSFNSTDPDFPVLDFKEIFTYHNMCGALKFSAIVLMALFTFAVEVLRYLGEYSIKFSHILVNLVHASTPICLGLFEFLTKCVGGFYWLIFVLIRGTPNTPAVPAALMNRSNQNLRALEYRKNDYSKSPPRYSQNKQNWNNYQRQY